MGPGPGPATKTRALARPMAHALFVAGPEPMSLVLWTLSYVLCPMSHTKIRHGYDADTTWILDRANIHEQYKVPWITPNTMV